jgi:hypothetical protein
VSQKNLRGGDQRILPDLLLKNCFGWFLGVSITLLLCAYDRAGNAVECSHGVTDAGCTLRSGFNLVTYAPSDCYRTPQAEFADTRARAMLAAEHDAQLERVKAWLEYEAAREDWGDAD